MGKCIVDPQQGPRIPGWDKYDPDDSSTLAILGTSTEGALPGDHLAADRSCAYWNTLLPIFPQVLYVAFELNNVNDPLSGRLFRLVGIGHAERNAIRLAGRSLHPAATLRIHNFGLREYCKSRPVLLPRTICKLEKLEFSAAELHISMFSCYTRSSRTSSATSEHP